MKKVIIMRGVPGSGKSTKAKTYGGIICSADDFFMQDGVYKFNRKLIYAAHAHCIYNFEKALFNKEPLVIVDNTHTRKWEYERYIKCAERYGYEVVIDSLKDAGLSCEELAKRNVHGVPIENIKRMLARWEE